jgi:hypothetical protein
MVLMFGITLSPEISYPRLELTDFRLAGVQGSHECRECKSVVEEEGEITKSRGEKVITQMACIG